MANPWPIVLDIEKLTPRRLDSCWRARQDRRYYGYNTLTGVPPGNRSYAQEFARHVDPFFPSMYTLDDNCAADLTALTLTAMGRLPKLLPTI